ncbi:ATP-binding protein [Roseicyclus persicicus]|uniref:C4-dicarboxylate transport sensor protein DctB n=1 Tax=Roseicyclus persicicus TaxID=2650661 RepID=A0A7X6H1R9_9RHOB|nr:ATP-binding protein [Roseibacterium persicicum]NKX46446.1 sensor histidine kinase [Roseibacterium persicicum]
MADAATATARPPAPPRARPRRRRPLPALAVALAGLALVMALAFPRVERAFLIAMGDRDRATLELATQVMRGALSRTEALPVLLAERPILARLLREPGNSGLLPFVNEQLRQTALSLDLSDVYLMDAEGLTIAASSYRTDRSFVGQRFAYRPYFTEALAGGLGRFHALGTTSGERGYFFAAPVIDGTEITGVVAVKITLDAFEATWADSGSTIIVQDMSNVIFLSDRADWHFRTLGPVPEAGLETIAATRQYPIGRLTPLPARRAALGSSGYEIVTIDGAAGRESYLMQTGLVAAAGWRVSILSPTAPATVQALTVMAVAGLAALFVLLIAAVIWQRRIRLEERLAAQAGEQARLEARVRERTRDLDAANAQLRQEVEVRARAEAQLRKTQAELVQAGKLAALGQMSAALSHEFNQPLAAVKAYAENAATFLDRGREGEARENIRLISTMADRMASISKHLRNFARRPQDKTGPVPMRAVIEDALELMRPRLDKAGARLDYAAPAAEVWVTGGRVRLQQVIVNLIGNALDAMEGREPPEIALALAVEGRRCLLEVRDRGPGLSEDALAQAFDPFFTTKAPGQGLGLGLSISYNIVRDFNGRLTAANRPEGGAVFTVELDLADPPAEMAAE